MSDKSYHQRRKDEHREWLRGFKKRCGRCSEQRPHLLTVLDPLTGRGVGMSEGGWSMPAAKRARLADLAIVLCQRCGHRYRMELRAREDKNGG